MAMLSSARDHRDMPDETLARLVAAGDSLARQEVRRRFGPVATKLAQRICSRLAHRGRPCPGRAFSDRDCDLAFTWVEHELLDQFAGHDRDEAHPRARKGLVVTWLEQRNRSSSFAQYAFGPTGSGLRGMLSDGRRAWNVARGLKARLHLPVDLRAEGPERYQRLLADPRLGAAADRLGLAYPEALWRWLDALFVDACDTGLDTPIDVGRVTRYLAASEPDGAAERAVAQLAPAVDELVAACWPEWYDVHLSRPRQHTRAWIALSDLDRGGAAGCDGRRRARAPPWWRIRQIAIWSDPRSCRTASSTAWAVRSCWAVWCSSVTGVPVGWPRWWAGAAGGASSC
jgi:hypothetical protein